MPNTDPGSTGPSQGFRVVAIGGGTGLSTILKGLKRYTIAPGELPPQSAYISDLTAVVTVSDDGGSSGRLRRELNMLPPGDVRNCLVAVAADENLISKLFQHRFSSSGDLEGHNFGNLFLAALTAMTGDFAVAVKKASEILATRGHILPATSANVQLEAVMDDGSHVVGETKITASEKRITQITTVPKDPLPLPQTLHPGHLPALRPQDLRLRAGQLRSGFAQDEGPVRRRTRRAGGLRPGRHREAGGARDDRRLRGRKPFRPPRHGSPLPETFRDPANSPVRYVARHRQGLR
jgi:hypothetical protein